MGFGKIEETDPGPNLGYTKDKQKSYDNVPVMFRIFNRRKEGTGSPPIRRNMSPGDSVWLGAIIVRGTGWVYPRKCNSQGSNMLPQKAVENVWGQFSPRLTCARCTSVELGWTRLGNSEKGQASLEFPPFRFTNTSESLVVIYMCPHVQQMTRAKEHIFMSQNNPENEAHDTLSGVFKTGGPPLILLHTGTPP